MDTLLWVWLSLNVLAFFLALLVCMFLGDKHDDV